MRQFVSSNAELNYITLQCAIRILCDWRDNERQNFHLSVGASSADAAKAILAPPPNSDDLKALCDDAASISWSVDDNLSNVWTVERKEA